MSEALIVALVILSIAAPVIIAINRKRIAKRNPDDKFVDESKKTGWRIGTVKQTNLTGRGDGTDYTQNDPNEYDSDDGEDEN